jgi:hypothetical protein
MEATMKSPSRSFLYFTVLLFALLLAACAPGNATDTQVPDIGQGQVSFTGSLQSIEPNAYTISGVAFKVDANSQLLPGLKNGVTVKVKAQINPDGSFNALVISPISDSPGDGLTFEFGGVIESIGDDSWVISGQTVDVDSDLKNDDNLTVDGTVKVKGTWVSGAFNVESVEPWTEPPAATETRLSDHTPEATRTPEPTRTPGTEPTHVTEPSRTPEPTHKVEPTSTRKPEPTRPPETTASRSPDPTGPPESTATHAPEPTHNSEPTATKTPEPTKTHAPEVTATHQPESTATHVPEVTATSQPESTATHPPEPTRTPTTTI